MRREREDEEGEINGEGGKEEAREREGQKGGRIKDRNKRRRRRLSSYLKEGPFKIYTRDRGSESREVQLTIHGNLAYKGETLHNP